MISKTVKYTDYNGVDKEEKYHFNINKVELYDMEMSVDGGFMNYLQGLVMNNDVRTLYQIIRDIIVKSYGVKTIDGRFEKSDELTKKFMQTEAYSVMMSEFLSNSNELNKFIEGILPSPEDSQVNKHPALLK